MAWQIGPGKFKKVTFHVAVPASSDVSGVMSQEIKTERRLQVSERPLVDGGDVEDFGRKPNAYSAEVIFYGDDYRDQLNTFLEALNEGTTGVLVLPDMPEAVLAKFQSLTRKTTVETCTVLTVNWIEDQSVQSKFASGAFQTPSSAQKELEAARLALKVGKTANALSTVQSACAKVKAAAAAVQNAITNNALIRGIREVQSNVVSVVSAGNSILNIATNAQQNIISLANQMNTTLTGVQGLVAGVQQLTDLLNLQLFAPNPSRFSTALAAIDFTNPAPTTVTIIDGNQQVVTTPDVVAVPIQSYDSAVPKLQAQLAQVQAGRQSLESASAVSSFPTTDVSLSSVQLENSLKDLIYILEPTPTQQVLTTHQTSLLEVCFEHGLDVSQIDRVYSLNRHIDDVLDIQPYTVVNL
jgi:prophage DNA circulation protein